MLGSVSMVANRFVTIWRTDAHEKIQIHTLDGRLERELFLPAIGAVPSFSGRRRDAIGFYAFTSFAYPTTVYSYDFATEANQVFRKPAVRSSRNRSWSTSTNVDTSRGLNSPMHFVPP